MKTLNIHLAALALIVIITGSSHAAEIEPFYSRNQNPFVQIYGLPVAESGFVAQPGEVLIGHY